MPASLEVPADLAELARNPERIRDAFALLRALSLIEVHLIPPASSVKFGPGKPAILGEPPNLILPLPIRCPSAIADSTATAASASAQLNALLAALRQTGILPS